MKLPFLLNSISKCNNLNEIELIFNKLLKVLPSLDGNTVSHCLNTLSKKEINHSKLFWNKTAELLTQKNNTNVNNNTLLSNYDVKHVCIILNSFAKVDHLSLKLIETSTNIIIKHIRNVHTKDICNVIHSLGKFNQFNPLSKILNKLLKINRDQDKNLDNLFNIISGCNEKDFSMLLRVFLLNSENLQLDSITANLLKCISDKYDNLSDQTLAILSNALANYGRDENQTLNVLAPIITFRLKKGHFTPQCVAQISNGYAKLNRREPELFAAISERVVNDISAFSPRCLSNVLNAFSKLSILKKDLFVRSIAQLELNVHSMTPQCLGNIINSYTRFINAFEPRVLVPFFNNLIAAVLKFDDFDAFIGQNYANILNGVSKLYAVMSSKANSDEAVFNNAELEHLKVSELFIKLSDPMIKAIDRLNHLDVLLIANSMARCRVVHPGLLDKLMPKLKSFSKRYKTIEAMNAINTLSSIYKSIALGEYVNISQNEHTSDGMDVSTESTLKQQIMDHYLYFLDHFFENIDHFKNIRPADVKMLFNSFERCNVNNKEYFDVLVDKYIDLNQPNLTELASIVNRYSNCKVSIPPKLKDYILGHLQASENDHTLVYADHTHINQMISQVNKSLNGDQISI